MKNQWKRAFSGIVVLAMLLSCAAVNVFADAGDLKAENFTLDVSSNSNVITVQLICEKAVTGWGGGAGTLSVKNDSNADASQYFTVSSRSVKIGDNNSNTDNKWVWSSTVASEKSVVGETLNANDVWVEYQLAALSSTPAGTYTFSMTFDDNNNIDVSKADYEVSGQTITAANAYTVAAPTGYTVAITDGYTGTAEANPTNTVTMDVIVSGKDFNGMQAEITYDKDLFELTNATGVADETGTGLARDINTATDGKVSMYLLSTTARPTGTKVATLTFTAKALAEGDTEGKTGEFTIAKGTADDLEGFASHDAVTATLVGDSVKVVPQKSLTITIDSGIENGTVTPDKTTAEADDTVTLTVSPDPGYELDTLTVVTTEDSTPVDATRVSDTTYTFTMPDKSVTVSATFKDATYSVTLSGALTGESTATHGTNYVAQVTAYNTEANDYTLTVSIDDVQYMSASIDESGRITIPGSLITGDIKITLTTTPKQVIFTSFDTKVDYVTGYTLVLVTGDSATGYTYDGNAMYYTTKYSSDSSRVYLYLVDSAANSSNVAVASADATCTEIPAGYDVNGTGTVDFNDAGAAFGCYNRSYTLSGNIALYLRADVNADKSVNVNDVSAIMSSYTAAATGNSDPTGEGNSESTNTVPAAGENTEGTGE